MILDLNNNKNLTSGSVMIEVNKIDEWIAQAEPGETMVYGRQTRSQYPLPEDMVAARIAEALGLVYMFQVRAEDKSLKYIIQRRGVRSEGKTMKPTELSKDKIELGKVLRKHEKRVGRICTYPGCNNRVSDRGMTGRCQIHWRLTR